MDRHRVEKCYLAGHPGEGFHADQLDRFSTIRQRPPASTVAPGDTRFRLDPAAESQVIP